MSAGRLARRIRAQALGERSKLLLMVAVFLLCWLLPANIAEHLDGLGQSLALVRWYAREHVLLCLVPAFFIAGAIAVFVNQGAVLRYLGPSARKVVAYPVAAVSGGILAVCSCTVLPLFASIHKRGAGLGPASAFLYAGPAINVLAIILTAQVLGLELGVARAVGAVVFSLVIGVSMHAIFRRSEADRAAKGALVAPPAEGGRSLGQEGLFFAAMLGVLIFANWGRPEEGQTGVWASLYAYRWVLVGLSGAVLLAAVMAWFRRSELEQWVDETWGFAKQILPLLLAGVAVAGFLLGGPGGSGGVIPAEWVQRMVGGNSVGANAFASVAGALMYFATLTEVPILEGLLHSGMGKGPALALLLAGPALSLPNMLVIRSVLGTKQTVVYVGLVVVLSSAAGLIYGSVVA